MSRPGDQSEDELTKVLQRLIQEVVLGKAHLKIWRGLAEALAKKPEVSKTAPTFFGLTLQAHLEAALLHAAKLFDTHRQAMTIKAMLELAEKQADRFQNATREEVQQYSGKARGEMVELEKSLRAVRSRRNKVIAHLDPMAVLNPQKVTEGGKLTIEELQTLYKAAAEILNNISASYRGVTSLTELVDQDDYENAVSLIERAKHAQIEEHEKEFDPLPYGQARAKSE